MRFLAIDPSLRSTGLAGVGWTEAIKTGDLRGHDRLRYIQHALHDYYMGTTLAVIEGPAYGAKGRSVHQLAGLWWIIAHDLWMNEIPYVVVDPRSLKLYATNNGNAKKEAVAYEMTTVHPSRDFETYDESDAYALLTMAHDYYGGEMGCCGAHHLFPDHKRVSQALGAVDWPDFIPAK